MKLLVLGAAVSGVAAARLGQRLGYDVAVYDQSAHAVAQLRGSGMTLHSGSWTARHLRDIDLVVTSPGIPEHAAPIEDTLASAAPLLSEMEFAARRLDAPYVAVTGTNGKTTVTEAAAAMLHRSGIAGCAAGNIGTALSDVVAEPCDAVVIEASSFQLRFTEQFAPVAAAITNVAPDHLDWHGDEASYADAKARLFASMEPQAVVAYDADDPGASALAARSRTQMIAVSGRRVTDDGYGVAENRLVLGALSVPAPDLGAPFLADLALAAVIAKAVGATDAGIAEAVGEFRPGAHRRTVVAEVGGVAFVDDSKATNPHAAVASAGSYPSVILIAGGRNKGLDLSPIARVDAIRLVIGLGEAADELAALFEAERFRRAADMDEAVAIARSHAQRGDVVLLAPGCASFDMYGSYAERGDAFAAAVHRLEGAA